MLDAHPNLGDVVVKTVFSDYEDVSGVKMPKRLTTTIDKYPLFDLRVSRNAVNADTSALAAPAAVTSAPVPAPPAQVVTVEPVSKGIWRLAGSGNHRSIVLEFDDHLVLFETPLNEARSKPVIDEARKLSSKPLTHAVVSHHHFDHSGGLRVAVAEGLTIITQRGNESLFRELAERPAMVFRDALGRSRREIRLRLVDDSLRLRDGAMEIDIYRVVANSHMADALMVHVPRERLLVQGDLFDASWQLYWWGSSYMDNVQFRKIQVERDVPVHGQVLPIAEVRQHIERQIRNTQNLCASAEQANLSLRGCPVKLTIDR
jgi:glyoxylase-like metal-dependent hydrolase (beta-lactamase superfamily II)